MMMISNPKQNFLVMKLGFVKKTYCSDFENSDLYIKAKKVHLFRPCLGFLSEAQPRPENRPGQKILFGRGAH
jgi:hypothetical protein